MIKNFQLVSKSTYNFASDLSSIREFRKRTKHSRDIFKAFENNGVRIVRLKKREARSKLSEKQKKLLADLQNRNRKIIEQVGKIMAGSEYTARDVLSTGYPELFKGERASWMGFREQKQEVENTRIVVKPEEQKKEKPKKFGLDDLNEAEENSEGIDSVSEKKSKEEGPKEGPKNEDKSESQYSSKSNFFKLGDLQDLNDEESRELIQKAKILQQKAEELESEIQKNDLIEISDADRLDNSFWGQMKVEFGDFVNELHAGSLKEYWTLATTLLSGPFQMMSFFTLMSMLSEEIQFAASVVGKSNIVEECAESALKKWPKAGWKHPIAKFRSFFRSKLVPVLIKVVARLDNTKLMAMISKKFGKAGATKLTGSALLKGFGSLLGSLASGLALLQFIVWWIENFWKALAHFADEKVESGDLLKAAKTSLTSVATKFQKSFTYLNFNTDNFRKDSLGLYPFMTYSEYEPLAYCLDKDKKPVGMLYLSVCNLQNYKAGTGDLEEFLPEELRSSFISAGGIVDEKNIKLKPLYVVWFVAQDGDSKARRLLVAYDARNLMLDFMFELLQVVSTGNSISDMNNKYSSNNNPRQFINLTIPKNLYYLFTCDTNSLPKDTKVELENTSIFKALRTKLCLFVTQLGQILINFASNLVRSVLDRDAALEGREDFVTSGSLDPVELMFCPFSDEAWEDWKTSWKPLINNL